MAAQAMEALNRTFIELKSKNDDIKLRASYDLRDLVVSAARGKAFCHTAHSPQADCSPQRYPRTSSKNTTVL